ncbi:MAG TPA: RsmG family class I SAM-dependent methyltransferase [Candidatus Binataceae bacterium]|nr:RsmG family class I SAM-dependent methyltransferase [Candidatus Binataceae bacterium]
MIRPSLDKIGITVRDKVIDALTSCGIPVPPEFAGRIACLATAIALWGPKTNLTAAPLDPEATAFHILDSLAPMLISGHPLKAEIAAAMAAGARVLDLGSGAGFPALVLASIFDAEFTLAESRRKRASFLITTAAEMNLSNVTVQSGTATAANFEPRYDIVTERALGPLKMFHPIAGAALRVGGLAIAYSVESADISQLSASAAGLDGPIRLGYSIPGRLDSRRMLMVWRKAEY